MSHRELAAELRGTRIGIMGFPPSVACRLASVLQAAGSVSGVVELPLAAFGNPLEHYDALLVSPGDELAQAAGDLVAVPRPWLLVGIEESISRYSGLNLHADDILFAPYSSEELLFRLSRAMRRRVLTGQVSVTRRPSTLVIADDDPAMIAFLKAVLANSGLECHFAMNGREALAITRKLLPDLVLLDINMPLFNGLQVLRLIRKNAGTRSTRVLLVTASENIGPIERGCSLHADGYLGKPLNPLQLTRRIETLLASSGCSVPPEADPNTPNPADSPLKHLPDAADLSSGC